MAVGTETRSLLQALAVGKTWLPLRTGAALSRADAARLGCCDALSLKRGALLAARRACFASWVFPSASVHGAGSAGRFPGAHREAATWLNGAEEGNEGGGP